MLPDTLSVQGKTIALPTAQQPFSTEQALALFDSLPAVSVDSMWGRWHGAGRGWR